MIIDEATLAGTTTLDRLTGIAAAAGAKVLLVATPSSSSPSMPAERSPARRPPYGCSRTDRDPSVPQRMGEAASLGLRRGEVEVISTYAPQDRIREGDRPDARRRL